MKILVTGGSGLLGNTLKSFLFDAVYVRSKEFDLTDQRNCRLLIDQEEPDWIIHGAAKVGGIFANETQPNSFYEDNILINTNMVRAARIAGVKRFTGIISTCAYPDNVPSFENEICLSAYPLKEDYLHQGPPSESNFGYGIAKRALATHIDLCNEEYGTKYNYLIPCNLYGPHDNYDLNTSHFVAALIRKIYEARKTKKITLFGDGSPIRQFMLAKDLASIILRMITLDITDSFNVATPEVRSIKDITRIALQATGHTDYKVEWTGANNGQYRKDVDISKFRNHFPDYVFDSLDFGIRYTFLEYIESIKR
jgi:GDP-L-fucose synthase